MVEDGGVVDSDIRNSRSTHVGRCTGSPAQFDQLCMAWSRIWVSVCLLLVVLTTSLVWAAPVARASYDFKNRDIREVLPKIARDAGVRLVIADEAHGRTTAPFASPSPKP
jgi:hypothetical protein